MKRLSPLLVFLFAYTVAFGQFEWVFDNDITHEYIHQFVKTQKNQYVILHGKTDDCCPEKLTVLDSNGIMLFNFTASGGANGLNISHFKDIMNMPDSTISVVTANSVYDSSNMQGFVGSAVMKLDANWIPTIVAENYFSYFDAGDSFSDGSYLLVKTDDGSIWRKSNDGNDIWGTGLTGNHLLDLSVNNNDNILLATLQGLIVMDQDGIIVGQYPVFVFNQIKTDGQDGIIGVRDDSVFLLSPNYNLVAANGYQGDDIKDFSVENGMIAVLTASGHVYRYNGALSPLNDFQLLNDGDFSHIAIGNERIVMAGMERYGGAGVGEGIRTVFVKEYSFEGDDYNLSKDVGIVGVDPPQETQVINLGNKFKVIFKNIKVKVRNFGANPVESLYLRKAAFKSNSFNNLGLALGEEVELTIEAMEITFSSDPAGLELNNLCFWTSHPDLLMDADASNDSYCTDFLVNSKAVIAQNNIAIYPNPSSDIINIQLEVQQPVGNIAFRIMDVYGKVVEQPLPTQMASSYSIPVSDWATGIYFLQLLDNGAVLEAKKFVVIR